MRRLTNHLVAGAALLAAAVCRGEAVDLAASPLTLPTVITYARQHNAAIHAAAARGSAAQARPAQAGALPDPMLEFAYHNEGFDRLNLGETDFAWARVGASQELPFPGKLGLKREIASRDAEQMHEEARRVDLDVVTQVRIAYAEYAHLEELLDILQRNRALLQNFARSAEARYAVGEGIQQDVLKAEVELSLLADRETTFRQRQQSQTAELNALLNRAPTAPLGTAEHPTEKALTRSLEDLLHVAERNAPEVKAAADAVAGRDSALALARRELLPDFVVRAEYMHKSALLPEWEVGIGVKVPLYFATKQDAGIEEAAAARAAAQFAHENAARAVQARISDAYARAQAAERLTALYHGTVIPQARLALDSAISAYQVGKADFLTLINAFTVVLEYEMRYHEELADFQKAVAQLEQAAGLLPENLDGAEGQN